MNGLESKLFPNLSTLFLNARRPYFSLSISSINFFLSEYPLTSHGKFLTLVPPLPFFPNEAFYPSRPTVSATPDFLDISINFPGKGLLLYGRILECSYSASEKARLRMSRRGEGGERERKGRKNKRWKEREKKGRNNDSRRLIFVSFACCTRTPPFESFRAVLYPRSHHFPSLRNVPSVVMGSSTSRVDFELWQIKICFFKVFRKMEEIISNGFESSKIKKK